MSEQRTQLTRELMIDGFRDVVELLAESREHHSIYLVGGAAMSLRYMRDRRLTPDMDAKLAPASTLLEAAREVAVSRGWDRDWLNDKAAGFVPIARDVGWDLLYSGERVSIYVASPQCLLAMKLRAGRRGREEDDIAVLLALCGIADVGGAEELFEEFYPGELLPDRTYRMLETLFKQGIPPAPPPPPLPCFGRELPEPTA